MNEEVKYIIADIEYYLGARLRPSFLVVLAPEECPGEISIIVSAPQFRNMPVQKRIATIFDLLNVALGVKIQEWLIVVQAYDSAEMEDYIDNMFGDENE